MNLLTNSMPGSLPPGVRLDDDQEDEVKMMDMFNVDNYQQQISARN